MRQATEGVFQNVSRSGSLLFLLSVSDEPDSVLEEQAACLRGMRDCGFLEPTGRLTLRWLERELAERRGELSARAAHKWTAFLSHHFGFALSVSEHYVAQAA